MEYEKKKLNTVKRGNKKASYDKAVIHQILDASDICSVAFLEEGRAFVQPINFGRSGQFLYLHGQLKNRMTQALIDAGEVTLSVMHLDAMKLTRSAYSHSVNFRSVLVFGKVRELKTDQEKLKGLKSIINHFVPDRWDACRPPTQKELDITKVIEIEIETASAKVANSPPADEEDDYHLDHWAGTIPVRTICDYPIPDGSLKEGLVIPSHVLDFYESHKA